MTDLPDTTADLKTVEALLAYYGTAKPRSLTKQTDRIVPVYRPFIEAAPFAVNGKPAVAVLIVSTERVYYQCPKALARSELWNADNRIERSTLPSAGDINQYFDESFDGAAYDAGYPEYMKQSMY